jgi:ABC-type antimicrobial peptide transport system permease subunit
VVRVPANTHLQAAYLLPISFMGKNLEDLTKWGNFAFYTYIQLREGVSARPEVIGQIADKINALFATNESEYEASFHLQLLTDIYLNSDLFGDVPWRGNIQYVRAFSVAAICILIVACINFMNLSTARSARRAKEVGLRKVIGARRSQLMGQFLSESLLVAFLALVLALGMIGLLLPVFNNITDKELSLNFLRAESLAALVSIALLTGLLSGSYPALFLSAFQPVKVLKGITKTGRWSLLFRNGLVVAQFAVSVVLIVGTVTVYNQLELLRNKHLGFDKENLLHVPIRGELWKHIGALRTELAQNPLTHQFSVVSELPVNNSGGSDVQWEGKNPQEQVLFSSMQVDEHFLQTFGVELLAGRGFSAEFRADTSNYLLNEAALQLMGMDVNTAIGKWFDLEVKGKIIGVVKDFNFRPLHQRVEPLVLQLHTSGHGQVVVRTQPNTTEATIRALEKTFGKLNPDYPFSYGFVDEEIAKFYTTEKRIGQITNIFALLAIFISCLGLYGLAAFSAERRTKEIGIRKVLGASVSGLSLLISRDFIWLVLIAFCLAAPIAWYVMHEWLQGFAYRVDMSLWSFAFAGLLALLIALLTVSFQSIKAALANPVKSLRNE